MKNLRIFVVLWLLIFSCKEKEEPQTIYGQYLPQTITADKAIDITGDGVASTDLFNQFRTSGEFFGKSTGIIFLTLYTPEYFNLHFSQVLLRLPYHFESENGVAVEYLQDGRRFDLEDDGRLALTWNTYPPKFDFPEQFQKDIVIESLKFMEGKTTTLELLAAQRLFDHSINDWVELKISYSFVQEN